MRPPGSAAASTAVAFGEPVATRFVPSSGSTAMSTVVAASAIADLLADVEHGRLVALALADDDGAADLRLLHGAAHRLDGGVVGAVAVATSHEPRSGDARRPRWPRPPRR